MRSSRAFPAGRGTGRWWRLSLPAVAVVAGLWATAAPAQYVFYFGSHGDWSVVCAQDNEGRKSCRLSAPPPVMGSASARSEIVVDESGGRAALRLRIQGAIEPGSPIFLRVDAASPIEAVPSRVGEIAWEGDAARTIIETMAGGRRLVLRSFNRDDRTPRDEIYTLDAFGAALQDYRMRQRAYEAERR